MPLWIADMDFATLKTVAAKIAERAEHLIYAYNAHKETFNQAIVDWVKRRHHWDIEKEWIIQAPGVVPSIILSILALLEPGDGIIFSRRYTHRLNPGKSFGSQGEGFARINFATQQSVLLEAVTRIEKALNF